MKLVRVEGEDRIVNLDGVQSARYYGPEEDDDGSRLRSELFLYFGGTDGGGESEAEVFFDEAADALWDYLCRAAEPVRLRAVPPGAGSGATGATHTSPSPAGASTAHEAGGTG